MKSIGLLLLAISMANVSGEATLRKGLRIPKKGPLPFFLPVKNPLMAEVHTAIHATAEPWGGHVVDYAFDNDVNTYYDADGRGPQYNYYDRDGRGPFWGTVIKACFAVDEKNRLAFRENPYSWRGVPFILEPIEISTIKFHPRKSGQIHADRMKGGIWKCDGSLIATTTSVTMNTWNQVPLAASVTCSCVTFTFSNTGDYGSVAEISIEPKSSSSPTTPAPTPNPTPSPTTTAPTPNPTPSMSGSCEESCGEATLFGNCYCDLECFENNDCCDDIGSICGIWRPPHRQQRHQPQGQQRHQPQGQQRHQPHRQQ